MSGGESRTIETVMENASVALTEMRYFECERLCVEALGMARAGEDFDSYSRIMLPLQEARRQRRQVATEAGVAVLSGERLSAGEIVDRHEAGCLLMVSPPYSREDERRVRELALERERFIEPLVLDGEGLRKAFEGAMESEGDSAVADLGQGGEAGERVDRLAAILERVGDHEIAHQRLQVAAAEAAKQRGAEAG